MVPSPLACSLQQRASIDLAATMRPSADGPSKPPEPVAAVESASVRSCDASFEGACALMEMQGGTSAQPDRKRSATSGTVVRQPAVVGRKSAQRPKPPTSVIDPQATLRPQAKLLQPKPSLTSQHPYQRPPPRSQKVPPRQQLPKPPPPLRWTQQPLMPPPQPPVPPPQPPKPPPPQQQPTSRSQPQWHPSEAVSQRVLDRHRQWQQQLLVMLQHAPSATRGLCEPATRLDPIATMLLLQRLRPEQVASLSPPAVAQAIRAFQLKAEQLVFGNPSLSKALAGHGAVQPPSR